jgi:hypothetical protein
MRDDEMVTMAVLSVIAALVIAAAVVSAAVGVSVRRKVVITMSAAIVLLTGLGVVVAYQQMAPTETAYCLSLALNANGEWVCQDPPPDVTGGK